MSFFTIGLALACLSAMAGTLWRMRGWCTRSLDNPLSPAERGRAFLAFTFQGLRRLAWLHGLTDMLLLRRTFRTGKARWLGHTLLIAGFLPLLILHAMDGVTSRIFLDGYEPTLDPWQFLRNLFGLLSLIGFALLLTHRVLTAPLKRLSTFQDWSLLGVVGLLLLSGFLLETAKIISPLEFIRMVDDYFLDATPEEQTALKAWWATNNGVLFGEPLTYSPEILAQGQTLHEDHCAGCHAPTNTAFVSRTLASLVPNKTSYSRTRAHKHLWYLHAGCAFLALGLLPWGKFFHPLATTANLLARRGERSSSTADVPEPARSALRGLGLDACTRCGQCSLHCSVAPIQTVLGNQDILPSEKLADLRRYLDGGSIPAQGEHGASFTPEKLSALVEGSHICTECLRCTEICSAGIDLQDLWLVSKKALTDTGRSGPDGEIRKRTASQWASDLSKRVDLGRVGSTGSGLADRAQSFWGCVQCTTCTSVCPVVAVSDDPARDLDLLPQQIMNLLRMGLKAQTMGARMVWSCTTCYKCQEHCPQNVPVADVLYELRNLGAEVLRPKGGKA